jgi:hypothetical protein
MDGMHHDEGLTLLPALSSKTDTETTLEPVLLPFATRAFWKSDTAQIEFLCCNLTTNSKRFYNTVGLMGIL